MIDYPTDDELADAFGVSTAVIARYVEMRTPLAKEGAFLVTFSADTPDVLRKQLGLNSARTRPVLIPPRR